MDRLGKVRKRAGGHVDVSAAKRNVPIGASTKRRRVLKALQPATPEDSAKRSLNSRKPDAIPERRATHPASPKTSPINASPVETPRSKRRLSKAERSAAKCHPIPKIVLPEHFVLLERVFEALQTVALLRASCRGQRSSFDKCRADVERYTRRRFEVKHLQQLKYLLPDVVQLEYAKAGGIDKRNNDTELVFRIEAGTSGLTGGSGGGGSLKDRLRRGLTTLVVEHYKQYLIAQGQPQPREAVVWKGEWDPGFLPGSTPEVPLAELPPKPAPCTPSSSCQHWNSSNASTPASHRTPIRTPGSVAGVRSRLSFGEDTGSAAQGSSAIRPRVPPHTPPSQVQRPHGAGSEVTSKRRTWLCSAAAAAACAGSATPPEACRSASAAESRPATPAASSPAEQPAGLAALQLFTPRALQRMAENTARRVRYHSAEAQAKQSEGVAAAQLPCMLDRLLSYFHHKGASALPYDTVVDMLSSQSSRGVIYSAEEVGVQLQLLRSAAPEALALEPVGGQHPEKVRMLVQAATAAPVRARLLKMVANQQALD